MVTKFDLWLEKVNEQRKEYWDTNFSYKPYEPLRIEKGKKYIKLIDGTAVWGFVSMLDGFNKGSVVKKGDLLKAADWRSPAKHSRGNIFKGTDSWEYYGPKYLG
jgi:hypothetical protein